MTAAKTGAKKGLSREEAAELYADLRKALAQSGVKTSARGGKASPQRSNSSAAAAIAAEISNAMKKDEPRTAPRRAPVRQADFDDSEPTAYHSRVSVGNLAAVLLIVVLGLGRIALTAGEAMGMVGFESLREQSIPAPAAEKPSLSKEETRILTSLDARRAELAERSKQLDAREEQINARDREFAVRLTQIKELTDKLKTDRDKNDKKRAQQLEQLANVYGSMSPQEAAQLMEQLDVSIALSLIQKMPEKRIGQILALMSKERALMLTRMLSAPVQPASAS